MRPRGAREFGSGTGPPLGLLSLAAFAREARPGCFAFELHDEYFHTGDQTRRWLASFRPEVVAISVMTSELDAFEAFVALCAEELPGVPLVVGGPHASAYSEECLESPGVVAVVQGEGELPFVDVLDAVGGDIPWSAVRGALTRDDNGLPLRAPGPPAPELDTLPPPAFDLIDLSAYEAVPNLMATIVLPPHRYLPLFTTRGCPYQCIYCHRIFGAGFREHSVKRVVDDIERWHHQYGVQNFQFFDDIFNARPGRILEFSEDVRRRGLKVRFYFVNGLRFDKLDRAQLEALRAAGVVYVSAAIESASPRIQTKLRKKLDLERLLENAAIADELGLFVTGFMLVGIPGETRDDIELTIRAAESAHFHYVVFSILNPYKGTPIGDELIAQGVPISPRDLHGFYGHATNFAGFPEDEFARILREAYRRFWTPRRVLGFLARHPSLESYGSLMVPQTGLRLARRVLTALALRPEDPREIPWKRPAPLPLPLAHLARASALGVQWASRALLR